MASAVELTVEVRLNYTICHQQLLWLTMQIAHHVCKFQRSQQIVATALVMGLG